MHAVLSDSRVAILCTVIITYMVLNSPRIIDIVGSITTVLVAAFIVTLNVNPDILIQLSVGLISIGSQYYRERVE